MKPNPNLGDVDRNRAVETIESFKLDSAARRKFRKLELRRWSRESVPGPIDEYGYRDYIESR